MKPHSFFLSACLLGASALPVLAEDLALAVSTNVTTLDPRMSSTVQTNLSVASHIYTPLVIRTPDLSLAPAAAESWEAVDDTTWRFKLREDITFSDGSPLNAEVVKWNIESMLDESDPKHNAPWFKPIESVEVTGPFELEIHTKAPYPALLDQMSMFFLMSPGWTEDHDSANDAMGSGPYELVSYTSGDAVVLKARDDYWGTAPEFDTVTIKSIPESATRVAGLLAGELDLVFDIPPTEISRINDSGKGTAGALSSMRSMFVKINTLKEPMGDVRLRQALNYAIDKEAIIDAFFEGYGEVSNCQVLRDGYFGYNEDLKPYAYDPEKARALVAETGLDTPIPVEFEVPVGRYLLASEIAQAVEMQLEAVGFDVTLKEMSFPSYIEKYIRANDLGQLSYLGQAWPTLDADGLLSLFEAGAIYAYWDDQPFKEALEKARQTVDPAERKEIYAGATERMCEQAPVAFMFNQPVVYAMSDRVDWTLRGDDWVRAIDVHLK
ncbi:ABC transporter substrate-binding protein [Salipiger abyssi]|uniref:Peptide/nickel transport system substrate-binding protein n=1 Tax=Salipiger abyssi TaxID=1250539 RepID=A0A1P8UU98_9RHOB|nr:ABC transporter substrate-binding protein [Salipiger abyssi]APZ52916.1 peptide/nickel transport system substrate-binding protein [Salipiger abyssi]